MRTAHGVWCWTVTLSNRKRNHKETDDMNKLLSRALLAVIMTCVVSVTALSQKQKSDDSLACRDNWQSDRLVSHCEIKEQTLPATDGTIAVDGRVNGGVSVKGWDRNEILMRARIQTAAPSEAEANDLFRQVTIKTTDSKIFASGPPNRTDHWWSVSYEVFVPRRSNLSLKTNNGGISIDDVNGRLELSGERWDGEALDVKTTNGGVSMFIPENYSAHLETGTVNGHLSIDFPVTVQGKITREVAVNLGAGGATIRAMTTNGGVRIKRGEGLDSRPGPELF